jgi:transposase
MALVRSRDALIRARTKLINHVRGAVKSNGKRLPSCATARFHKLEGELPETLASALRPMMDVIKELNERIRELDREIEQKSKESYPETAVLRHVPGVGPITALTFVLVIQNPQRFSRNRSVGPYLGLVPKRDQSGERDPQLSITKSGSPYLRRLLINASHHILGPFGPDTDLRRHGLKIAAGGGKRAKKRAVVAVARKLSILLLALLKTGEVYEPLRQAKQKKTGEAA